MPSEDTQFKPGNNANPKGRPKGSKSISDALRRIIDADEAKVVLSINGVEKTIELKAEGTIANGIATAMAQDALAGDIRAQQLIADRIEGKPNQSIDHTVDKPGIILSPPSE